MKLTKHTLKQIIKEELEEMMTQATEGQINEAPTPEEMDRASLLTAMSEFMSNHSSKMNAVRLGLEDAKQGELEAAKNGIENAFKALRKLIEFPQINKQ